MTLRQSLAAAIIAAAALVGGFIIRGLIQPVIEPAVSFVSPPTPHVSSPAERHRLQPERIRAASVVSEKTSDIGPYLDEIRERLPEIDR